MVFFLTGGMAMAGDSMTVTDMGGRKVAVPAPAKRIIAIGPGALRLICYLDAKDRVAAIENFEKVRAQGRPYWIASPELKDLPLIGPGGPQHIDKEPDLEAVLKVKPDVMFATYMKPSTADALQKKIGIPVVILTYGPFPDFDEKLYESLRIAGKILGKADRAEAVVTFIEDAKKDLQRGQRASTLPANPRCISGGSASGDCRGLKAPIQLTSLWSGPGPTTLQPPNPRKAISLLTGRNSSCGIPTSFSWTPADMVSSSRIMKRRPSSISP